MGGATPVRGSHIAGQGLWIKAPKRGNSARRHYRLARGGWTTVMSGLEGTGDEAPWEGGGNENCRPWLETLKPEGEGPTAPMPKAMRHGQRGGVDRDEKGLYA